MLKAEAANDPMPSMGRPPHGKTPVARASSSKWRQEDQLSLQLAITPDAPAPKSVKGRRSQPGAVAREKRGLVVMLDDQRDGVLRCKLRIGFVPAAHSTDGGQ